MKVGLFDHIGRGGAQLAKLYDDRLTFYSEADRFGFYCMHLAEHHCSPVNMAPSPSVFLAALARCTKTMRLGPLCYLLTLYSPLRILEEISMLDHLSHGRLDIGVGRGVSPFELGYHNVDHSKSRDMFIDAYECVREGMKADFLTYDGEFYHYKEAPIELHPFQSPPPFWYGSSNTVGATWAGEHGMHFTANGPTDFARKNIAAYKEALARRGGPEVHKEEFAGGAAIGALRQIVVAETDATGARHRRARGAEAPRRDQLAAQQAWRERTDGAAERPARARFRRHARGRNNHRRFAPHGAGRNPAADRGTGDKLRARLHDVRRHAA